MIQGLLGGTLDMAWLGASARAAVYVDNAGQVEPVLVQSNVAGAITYPSIGIARTDSGVASLADLEGEKFGSGDPNSTSGYLIPLVEIPEAGYSMTLGEFFGDVVFSGGNGQTILTVVNGDVDAASTWAEGYNSGALRKASDAGLVDMNDLVEISRSAPIPEGPVVLRTDLPGEVKATMSSRPISTRQIPTAPTVWPRDTAGFAPVTHEAYGTIIATREAEIGPIDERRGSGIL